MQIIPSLQSNEYNVADLQIKLGSWLELHDLAVLDKA
jgi:hypothetical protein